jgi:peroxiredoxin
MITELLEVAVGFMWQVACTRRMLMRQLPVNVCCPARSQVQLLADPHGELARGLGLELEAKAMLGTNRSKRYSAVIQDNEIKALNVEPDGSGEQA